MSSSKDKRSGRFSISRLFHSTKRKLPSEAVGTSLAQSAAGSSTTHTPAPSAENADTGLEQALADNVVGASTASVPSSTIRKSLDVLRDGLWADAYTSAKKADIALFGAYETVARDSADQGAERASTEAAQGHDDVVMNDLTAAEIETVAQRQKARLESKQWTYPWGGNRKKVRDTAESILKGVNAASGLISSGMAAAPPYVSLPWSMISVLLPFVLKSLESQDEAINGLSEVTELLGTYSYAEQEFLPHEHTRTEFSKCVLPLYAAVFRYQAAAATYFAKNTIKRMGHDMKLSSDSWKDALAAVKEEALKCTEPIRALSALLTHSGLADIKDVLAKCLQEMKLNMNEAERERRTREQIANWISPIQVYDDHSDVRQRLGDSYFDTGRWLLDDQAKYATWRHSDRDIFLLQGLVGSGKSCLTSIVIEDFRQNSGEQFAFFYCSADQTSPHQHGAKNTTLNVMRCMLSQSFGLPDGAIAEPVQQLYSTRQSDRSCDLSLRATVAVLGEVLELAHKRPITFIIDALDECVDQPDLLGTLAEIGRTCKIDLRIFISSRLDSTVSEYFPASSRLDIGDLNASDIDTYLENEIGTRSRGTRMTSEQVIRLKAALKKFSGGIFRWVELEIDIFLPRRSRLGRQQTADIERRLGAIENSNAPVVNRLFDSYRELYQFALGQQDETDRKELVTAAIKWVLSAFGTLHIQKLALFLALTGRLKRATERARDVGTVDGNQSQELRSSIFDANDNDLKIPQSQLEDIVEDIRDYCSNFFLVNEKGQLRIAHLSVRQFFMNQQDGLFSVPNQHLALALPFLQLRSAYLTPHRRLSDAAISGLLKELTFPGDSQHLTKPVHYLAMYAENNWEFHCRAAANANELEAVPFMKLLHSQQLASCFAGPLAATQLELARALDLSLKDDLGNTRLHRAVRLASDDVVALLVAAAAMDDSIAAETTRVLPKSMELSNKGGNTPLHLAAINNRAAVYTELYRAGVGMFPKDAFGLTPLQIAVRLGRVEILDTSVRLDILGSHNKDYVMGIIEDALALGHFECLAPLKGFVQASEALRRSTPSTFPLLVQETSWELSSHSRSPQVSEKRPQLYVRMDCKWCDLEGWIEGSRGGRRFLVTYAHFVNGTLQGCKLCRLIHDRIESKISAQRNQSDLEYASVTIWVELSGDERPFWTQGSKRDLLRISISGWGPLPDLEFCLDHTAQEDGEALVFKGRALPTNRSLDKISQTVSVFLDECRSSHIDSFGNRYNRGLPPPRIVDLGEDPSRPMLRVIKTNETHSDIKYAYLSYTRGDSGSIFEITADNEAKFLAGISLNEAESLHQDMFRLCRLAGYRYVWLDAFCIGKLPGVWNSEVLRIGEYVARADLILAAANTDVRQSLAHLESQGTHSHQHHTLDKCRAQFEVQASLDKSRGWQDDRVFGLLLREPELSAADEIRKTLTDRIWKVQEALLASRLVVVSAAQVSWSCGRFQEAESRAARLLPMREGIGSLVRWQSGLANSAGLHGVGELTDALYLRWYSLVELLSRGRISDENDRLYAVSGLIKAYETMLQVLVPNCREFVGLFTSDMRTGLLWVDEARYRPTSESIFSRTRTTSVASWSWAANQGPVSYAFATGLKLADAKALGFDVGRSTRGENELIVTSMTIAGSLIEMVAQYEYLWDGREFSQTSNADIDEVALLRSCRLILCAPWIFDRPWPAISERRKGLGSSASNSRWLGLALEALPDGKHRRRGVFMGPRTTEPLTGWKRMAMRLC